MSSLVRLRAVVTACAVALSCLSAHAQETLNNGSLSGRVADPQGAVVPGADVVARHADTNVTGRVTTDAEGRFRFPYLRVGLYEVTVRHPGFADAARTLSLTVGAAFDLPIVLRVAGVAAQVTVAGVSTVLDSSRSQIAGTVTAQEVRTLPMNGRQFLDLALLVPGVSPPNVGGTQLFAETSAVPGVGLSVSSQRNISNNFIVDGLSANDDAAALAGLPLGVDAVDQFQVVTSGGQAELGRALGGFVNVVTRSGTNVWHGDLYSYFRDDRFNGVNALSGTKLPMDQQQFGGSLGGPLRRDRTFAFANVEQRRLDQTGLTTITDANISVVTARLAAVQYPGAPVTTGIYPNPVETTHVLAKLDHQVAGHDQVSVRYSLYDVSSRNARGAGALSAPSASAGLDNRDQALAVGNTLTVSPRIVNETRGQVARGRLAALPTDPTGPAVSIAGVASFGTLAGSPTGRLNTMFQAVDNVSVLAGAHAVRAGIDVLYNDNTVTYPRAVRGTYAFSSLANFLAGTYNNAGFTQTFGDSVVSQTNPNLGLFAQDEWRVGRDLTLNLGVRYDLQFLETIQTDRNNLAPRLGLAWSPFEARRTVVRASGGLFFDRVPLRAVANALLSAGNTTDLANLRQLSVSLAPTQAGAPVFPGILAAPVPAVTLVNLTTMDRDLQNAYTRQAAGEVEQQFGAGTTLSVGYQYLRGVHLLMQVNQNVPTCVAVGTNNGCRLVAAYANNNQYSDAARSVYHGLHVSFVQRATRLASLRASYTLSTSKNNVGETFFSSPIDPFDLSKDWGRSDDDQRHRLVLTGSVNTPVEPARTAWQHVSHGFQVSGLLQTYSALPFNVTSGVTTLQGTAGRPVVDGAFIARNAGVGSDFLTVGLRVTRTFQAGRARLEGLVEGFNVTNRRNVVTRNTNFGTGAYPASPGPGFGMPTAVGEPRSFQFAVRARF